MSIGPHLVCQSFTLGKISNHHCTCGWPYSHKKPWGRNKKYQIIFGKRVWSKGFGTPKILPRHGSSTPIQKFLYLPKKVYSWPYKGFCISQKKSNTLDLLKETGMLGCKPAITPIDPNRNLGNEKILTKKEWYKKLVRKLMYLTHTRLDISFAVSYVSQFMNNPTEEHMYVVYRILIYLKGTPEEGSYFKK